MADVYDRLTSQVSSIAGIVSKLGLGIAAAQKEFNLDYVNNVLLLMDHIANATTSPLKTFALKLEAEASKGDANLEDFKKVAEKSAADFAGREDIKNLLQGIKNASGLDAVKDTLKNVEDTAPGIDDSVKQLLLILVPSLYQFTETTLEFSADLTETKADGKDTGLGIGLKAVVLNVSRTSSTAYDYRSAARISTVIHAIRPSDDQFSTKLLDRVTDLAKSRPVLRDISAQDRKAVDDAISDRIQKITNALKPADKTS